MYTQMLLSKPDYQAGYTIRWREDLIIIDVFVVDFHRLVRIGIAPEM